VKADTERFNSRSLPAADRPNKFYEFYVTGSGEFPTDMLRYDGCWPATTDDAIKLSSKNRRTIKLLSYREPTLGRWQSFVWSMSAQKPYPEQK